MPTRGSGAPTRDCVRPGRDRARTARHDGGVTGTQVQPQQSPAPNTAPAQARAIQQRIADELGVRERQVTAAVELLDGGATVPFVARYRKEATGSLDDAQLRTLEERLRYLRELEERRAAVLESIRVAGQARRRAGGADPRGRLEGPAGGHLPAVQAQAAHQGADRPRGRARAAGRRAARPTRRSTRPPTAAGYVDAEKGVADAAAALEGARAILVERFAEDADLIGELRERMWSRGPAGRPRSATGKEPRRARSSPTTSTSPSRSPSCPRTGSSPCSAGEKEDVLDLDPRPGGRARTPSEPVTDRTSARIAAAVRHRRPGPRRPTSGSPRRCAGPGGPGSCVRLQRRPADAAAARSPRTRRSRVFAANLRDLLLAAPAGTRADDGPGPGPAHRRQGRGRRRHRQGRRHRHDLPARAAPRLGRARWPPWPGWPARTTSS